MADLEATRIPIEVPPVSLDSISELEKRLETLEKEALDASKGLGAVDKAASSISTDGPKALGDSLDTVGTKADAASGKLETARDKVMSLANDAVLFGQKMGAAADEWGKSFIEASHDGAQAMAALNSQGLGNAIGDIQKLGAEIAGLKGLDDDPVTAQISTAIASGRVQSLKSLGIILDENAKQRIKDAKATGDQAGAQQTLTEVLKAGAGAVQSLKENTDPAVATLGEMDVRIGNLAETAGSGATKFKAAVEGGILAPLVSVAESSPKAVEAVGALAQIGGTIGATLSTGLDWAAKYSQGVPVIQNLVSWFRGLRAAKIADTVATGAQTLATEADTVATGELAIAETAAAGAAGAETVAAGTATVATTASGVAAAGAAVGFGAMAVAVWALVAPFVAVAAAALAATAAIAVAAYSWNVNKDKLLNPTSSTKDNRTGAQAAQDRHTESNLDELRTKAESQTGADKYATLNAITQKYLDLGLVDKAGETRVEANAARQGLTGKTSELKEGSSAEGKALLAQIRGIKADQNKSAQFDGSDFHGYQTHDFFGNVTDGGQDPQAKVKALLDQAEAAKNSSASAPTALPSGYTPTPSGVLVPSNPAPSTPVSSSVSVSAASLGAVDERFDSSGYDAQLNALKQQKRALKGKKNADARAQIDEQMAAIRSSEKAAKENHSDQLKALHQQEAQDRKEQRQAQREQTEADKDAAMLAGRRARNQADAANDSLQDALDAAKKQNDAARVSALTFQIEMNKAQAKRQEALQKALAEKDARHRAALIEAANLDFEDDRIKARRAGLNAAGEMSGGSATSARDAAIRASAAMAARSFGGRVPLVGGGYGNFSIASTPYQVSATRAFMPPVPSPSLNSMYPEGDRLNGRSGQGGGTGRLSYTMDTGGARVQSKEIEIDFGKVKIPLADIGRALGTPAYRRGRSFGF